jgi:hypothetical protein
MTCGMTAIVDFLFLVIFILIMDFAAEVDIHSPELQIFDGGQVVARINDANKYQGQASVYYQERCNGRCGTFDEDRYAIRYPEKLVEAIKDIVFVSYIGHPACNKLRIDITRDGKINGDELLSRNACIRRNTKIGEWMRLSPSVSYSRQVTATEM